MSMSRELKIQIDAIKKPDKYYYNKFDDAIMITDGVKGVYIQPGDVVIRLERLKNLNERSETLEMFKPKSILDNAVEAEKTKEAMILNNKTAVKFVSAYGEVWIDIKCIKDFEQTVHYHDCEKRIVVFIDEKTEKPVGFALGIKIREDEE